MLYRTLGAAALLIAAFGVAPAISADADDEPSLLALQSRAAMSGRPVRVIVEFAEPQASVPAGLSGVAADRIKVGAMRGRQAEILARVFGVDPMRTRAGNVNATLMDHLPMMAVEADADDLARLAADPSVKRIVEDGLNRPSLNQSVGIINMKGSGGAYSRGATGAGRAVAVIDTGVKKNHEFLSGKVISEACFSTNYPELGAASLCGGGVASSTATGSASDCPTYIPGCGHGTHVAAIAAGRNTSHNGSEPRHGVARNAGIVAIKVFTVFESASDYCGSPPCLLAYDSDIIRGLERVYDLRGGVSNRKIDAVNLSLGGGVKKTTFCSGNPLAAAVKKLRGVGIATVIASGNSGFKNGVSAPGCIQEAITVGASTKKSPGKGERIASYSNQGPQVDLLAPGGDFGYPKNSSFDQIKASVPQGYGNMAGTSMAAPHVAGAIAAIRSKKSCGNKTVAQINKALKATGPRITDHRNVANPITKRRLNVVAAMKNMGCG